MTNIERQEETGKTGWRPGKALLSGLAVGVIFFFVSRGIPWFSAEIPDAAMGRALFSGVPGQGAFVEALALHFVLAVIYALLITAFIYRLDPFPATLTGGLIGLALYAINYLLFHFAFGFSGSNESAVAITHAAFGLAVAGAYKAISVRRVFRDDTSSA